MPTIDLNMGATIFQQCDSSNSQGKTKNSPFLPKLQSILASLARVCCGWLDASRRTSTNTTWKTQFIRYGPVSGLACILIAFSSIFCSLAILKISDGQPVSQWKYQPSTYLAIFTALVDQSLRYAALQGVTVAWWLRALQADGKFLASLHHDWDMGTGLVAALFAGRRMNLLALACICATFVAIDGPLLQQSSNVKSALISADDATAVQLTFRNISPEIPTNYTGSFRTDAMPGWTDEDMNAWAAPVNFVLGAYRDYTTNTTIQAHVEGCSGSCNAQIWAPAVSIVNCTTMSGPVHFNTTSPLSSEDEWPADNYNPFGDAFMEHMPVPHDAKVAFYTNVLWTVEEKEYLNVTTISTDIRDQGPCSGIFNFTAYRLESAIAAYNVNVTMSGDPNDPTSASVALPQSVAYPQIVALANNTLPFLYTALKRQNSTLVGLARGLTNVVARHYLPDQMDVEDWTFATNPAMPSKHSNTRDASRCSSYSDPFEDVLDSLNRLMFRIGLAAVKDLRDNPYANPDRRPVEDFFDAGVSLNQTVQGYRTGTWNIYKTNYWWFVGAAAAQLASILIIFPLYWGWWRLGRAVSFSPLEIAKAFDAPLLVDVDSNLNAGGLAKGSGCRRVRYGVVGQMRNDSDEDEELLQARKVVFADPTESHSPSDMFDLAAA